MKKLLIATSNKGKFKEYTQLLSGLPFELLSLRDINFNMPIEENYDNYRENALHKAVTCAQITGLITLADDSGIEVDALSGEPGVMSSRYAGDDADDVRRMAYLLSKLQDIPWEKRTARFVCFIAVAVPPAKTEVFSGECEGYITFEPKGENGFGYDPVFYFPQLQKTMAELEQDVKNQISHRAVAAQKAYKMLEGLTENDTITHVTDSCHRPINYLRISVTDRCNLRCIYCQPAEGIQLMQHEEILTYEEIVRVTQVAAELGINKVRLTGGEPLVRLNVTSLVADIAKIKGIDDISLTTNGVQLKELAADLKKAGLKRVNVSLDTLQEDKFIKITRRDQFKRVIEGIEAAKKAGLVPVKINVVAMRGINDDEIMDFARLSMQEGWHIRFIELMPFNGCNPPEEHNIGSGGQPQQFMSIDEIKQKIETLGKLVPVNDMTGAGPAKYFRLEGARGTLGFISPVSDHFCFSCNRIRLTADGKLRPCLLSDREIDLKTIIRYGASAEQIREKILEAIRSKPQKHDLANGKLPEKRFMFQVGG